MHRMGDLYASNSQNMNEWVAHCKALLIKMECTNIETRSNHWSSVVNTQTHHTNHRLNLTAPITPYQYHCDPLQHLQFLSEWKGLKMRQITNYPRTYTEFEAKAKNWLNGRRAPNYGATLFPDMIKTAETVEITLHFVHGLLSLDFNHNVLPSVRSRSGRHRVSRRRLDEGFVFQGLNVCVFSGALFGTDHNEQCIKTDAVITGELVEILQDSDGQNASKLCSGLSISASVGLYYVAPWLIFTECTIPSSGSPPTYAKQLTSFMLRYWLCFFHSILHRKWQIMIQYALYRSHCGQTKYDKFMNRMYMKQNGGTLPMVGGLDPSLLATFNRQHGHSARELMDCTPTAADQPITKRYSMTVAVGRYNKGRGENASHSDASSASAITPITPSQSNHNHNHNGHVLQIPLMAQNVVYFYTVNMWGVRTSMDVD